MLARRIRPTYRPIGSTSDPADATARLEVCLFDSRRPGAPPVIYVTKYHGRAVGERSVGIHPDVADDIAAMLRAAASMARNEQPTRRRPHLKRTETLPHFRNPSETNLPSDAMRAQQDEWATMARVGNDDETPVTALGGDAATVGERDVQ